MNFSQLLLLITVSFIGVYGSLTGGQGVNVLANNNRHDHNRMPRGREQPRRQVRHPTVQQPVRGRQMIKSIELKKAKYRSLSPEMREIIPHESQICYENEHISSTDGSDFNPLLEGAAIISRYETLSIVGHGTFGVVIKAYDHCTPIPDSDTPTLVAIKILFPRAMSPRIVLESGVIDRPFMDPASARKEVQLLNIIGSGCRFCMDLLNNFSLNGITYLVMPLMRISLSEILYNRPYNAELSVQLSHVRQIGWQLFKGLACLHSKNYVHNDLKPDNIMIKSFKPVEIRINDFGLACRDNGACPWNRVPSWYEAPEITLHRKGSRRSDIWSIGMILAEATYKRPVIPFRHEIQRLLGILLLTGEKEFEGNPNNINHEIRHRKNDMLKNMKSQLVSLLKGKNPLTTREVFTNEIFLTEDKERESLMLLRDLILKCLRVNPEKRITAEQALDHPFFDRYKRYIPAEWLP